MAETAETTGTAGTIATLRRAVFARHSHPWSAWTRWLSAPLALVPVWTRRRGHAVAFAAWMVVNPVLFPRPRTQDAWATRAMLGEELWITERPRDAALAVNAAATAAMLAALVAARRRRAVPAAVATAAQLGLTMVYWELMVRYHATAPGRQR
ncbi:hypothetical protein B0I33_101432 [Prauserella shujinwangii]|uniref:Uncharacterized protein n=1 Tax=Prauserella shujinwangii TaxID=1453103 RepID=A0A2T0M3J5_9PSEU|nr:DUF6653 family protein [Prauserella shujinwangii]PRX51279.1 hypothetical protein B0I33_101432 [Prauserella shujinwangii]